MVKYKYVGVENTNGNRYDVTIPVSEFMEHVALGYVQNERIAQEMYYLLDGAVDPNCRLEHVDTYLCTHGVDWRVQLRLVVNRSELSEHWDEIVFMMRYADPMYEQYFNVRNYWRDREFYGVITFNVPAMGTDVYREDQ